MILWVLRHLAEPSEPEQPPLDRPRRPRVDRRDHLCAQPLIELRDKLSILVFTPLPLSPGVARRRRRGLDQPDRRVFEISVSHARLQLVERVRAECELAEGAVGVPVDASLAAPDHCLTTPGAVAETGIVLQGPRGFCHPRKITGALGNPGRFRLGIASLLAQSQTG